MWEPTINGSQARLWFMLAVLSVILGAVAWIRWAT